MDQRRQTEVVKKEKIFRWCLVIFIAMTTLWKLFLILQNPGPVLYGDELIYKRRAVDLVYLHKYSTGGYPLAYPVLISVGLLGGRHFYILVQGVNLILSIWSQVLVWKVSRLFLDENKSFFSVLASGLLPWQYMIPVRLLSENLFFPLLLLACYQFFLCERSNTLKNRMLLGFFLFLLHITRHVTLALLLAFSLAWIIDYQEGKGLKISLSKEKLLHLFQILATYAIGYLIWLVFMLTQGVTLSNAMGFGFSSKVSSSDPLLAGHLGMTVAFYLSYLILNLLFLLPVCMTGIFETTRGKVRQKEAKFVLLVFLIAGAATATAVLHSWRVQYNYPDFIHILGRYLWYLDILVIIGFFILEGNLEGKKAVLGIGHAIVGIMVVLSVMVLITETFWELREGFVADFNTKNIYYWKNLYPYLLGLYGISGLVLIKSRTGYCRVMYGLFLGAISLGAIYVSNYNEYERGGIFGRELYEFHQSTGLENYDYVIADIPVNNLAWDMEFWTIPSNKPVVFVNLSSFNEEGSYDYYKPYYDNLIVLKILNGRDSEAMQNVGAGTGLVYCEVQSKYEETPYFTLCYNEKTYGLYEYPVTVPGEIEVEQTYPAVIVQGEDFNVQPDGHSAMAFQTNVPGETLRVYADGQYLGEMNVNEEGVGAIILERDVYENKEAIYFTLTSGENTYTKVKESNVVEVPITVY